MTDVYHHWGERPALQIRFLHATHYVFWSDPLRTLSCLLTSAPSFLSISADSRAQSALLDDSESTKRPGAMERSGSTGSSMNQHITCGLAKTQENAREGVMRRLGRMIMEPVGGYAQGGRLLCSQCGMGMAYETRVVGGHEKTYVRRLGAKWPQICTTASASCHKRARPRQETYSMDDIIPRTCQIYNR